MSEGKDARGSGSLSPARLGEIVAHFAFYEAEPHAEILVALGYPPEALEQVESGRARLRWALDGGIREGGIDELRAFVTAYDIVFRRLRSRRPRLQSAAIDPRLEPAPVPVREEPRRTAQVPIPSAEAVPAAAPSASPSYLVQPRLGVQFEAPPPDRRELAPTFQPAAPAAPQRAMPDMTVMQAGPMVQDNETLPFVSAAKQAHREAPPAPVHVPTGTSAPSSESPISLPFVAQRAAREETKLRPDQIDLSLFPLELYAEISGGLARGDDRAKLLASRGLTDSLYDVLAQAWAKKLATDPSLMARFKELARQTAKAGKQAI